MKKTIRTYGLLLICQMLLNSTFGQKTYLPKIIHYGYDTKLFESKLVSELSINQGIFKKSYPKLIDEIIDSCYVYNCDFIKINTYKDDAQYKQPILTTALYQTDEIHRLKIFGSIDSLNQQREDKRNFIRRITGTYPKPKNETEEKIPFSERIRSIEAESIRKSLFEVGGGIGIEYFALLYNINAAADINLVDRKKFKINISNRTGVIGGIAPGVIIYTFPSVKYQHNVSNYWFVLNVGREYGKILNGFYSENENYQLNYRIDLGLRIFRSKNSIIEFYIPIRSGEIFPWYFTGLNLNYYYKI